ncbi:MAG TPA: Hsp20 family protein [Alphaproteobacteria bacterium]|nr:Hsp20 family protein [Alphaproteobacteria bacterium]
MTQFDFTPLFRSTIGFDRVADMLGSALASEAGGYPPYNIESTGENAYRITMAVAGFTDSEISIVQQENELLVAGERKGQDDGRYLYRGIAGRSFERRFQLADYVKVTSAKLENGLLQVDLVRELPEALRPRKIAITTGKAQHRLEAKAA